MSTGRIKLWWRVPKQPDSFNIYHALAPFAVDALPEPAATGLAATAREFYHLDRIREVDHYYRIASVKNGRLYPSRGIRVRGIPAANIDYTPTLTYSEAENHDINLTWTVPNPPDSYNVYHSLTPFDVNNLPEPLATGVTNNSYVHEGQGTSILSFYLVIAKKGIKQYPSNVVTVAHYDAASNKVEFIDGLGLRPYPMNSFHYMYVWVNGELFAELRGDALHAVLGQTSLEALNVDIFTDFGYRGSGLVRLVNKSERPISLICKPIYTLVARDENGEYDPSVDELCSSISINPAYTINANRDANTGVITAYLPPYVEPPVNNNWVRLQYDIENEMNAQFYTTNPFTYFIEGMSEPLESVGYNNMYYFYPNQELAALLMASKELKIRPSNGNNFGTSILFGNVLSWGGYGFDATLTPPDAAELLLSNLDIKESNIALLFNGDYIQAGEPLITNGILRIYDPSVYGQTDYPSLDDMQNGIAISGESGQTEVIDTTSADTSLVCYQWTAPKEGTVTFNTKDSDFDTLLRVNIPVINMSGDPSYRYIADDDDSYGNRLSKVEFDVTQGQLYYIMISGFNRARGNARLSWNYI